MSKRIPGLYKRGTQGIAIAVSDRGLVLRWD